MYQNIRQLKESPGVSFRGNLSAKILDVERLIKHFAEISSIIKKFEEQAQVWQEKINNGKINLGEETSEALANLHDALKTTPKVLKTLKIFIETEKEEDALLRMIQKEEKNLFHPGIFNRTAYITLSKYQLTHLPPLYQLTAHLIDFYGDFLNNNLMGVIGSLALLNHSVLNLKNNQDLALVELKAQLANWEVIFDKIRADTLSWTSNLTDILKTLQ